MTDSPGVSFVVPVHDGQRCLQQVLTSILDQDDGRPFEVIVVDDGGSDGSREIIGRFSEDQRVRILAGARHGAAAALNTGIAAARNPLICQVDQDVILHHGWLQVLCRALDDPQVAAAQGYYASDENAGLWQRLAGYELELRYHSMTGAASDHVCTGNSVYRAAALHQVGPFDEQLGYGYDNDMSYRLISAGHRLLICREATSTHCWRSTLGAYLCQLYGLGYGRLDLVAKHPTRVSGDRVSGLRMILHVPATLLMVAATLAAVVLGAVGGPWPMAAVIALVLLSLLTVDRLLVAAQAVLRFRDPAALLIVPTHLLRDLVWAWATVVWSVRRLLGGGSRPSHSMGSGNND